MKVRNKTASPRSIAPAGGAPIHVAAGAVVDVPDELGESLCEQPDRWEPVADKAVAADKED